MTLSYELWIALRYLRARRREFFISLITWISVGGVALGVAALLVVLSVMNGFEADLRDKILGTHAHVVVSAVEGTIGDPGTECPGGAGPMATGRGFSSSRTRS